MPPAKHRTFLRVQLSDRQAHGQTHRHSHALTPSETASQSTFVSQSQSHSTCERPGQEEGTGGPVSGDKKPERNEGSETDSKMAEGDRHACTHMCTHTHTDTHTQAGIDRQRETQTD